MQMGNLDAEMVWHQVVCSSVPRLMRPLRDLSPEEISRFFEARKLEQALALARVASPPSVAAEAPPQVVSNDTDVGDAPQDADATVQIYGGVDLADTDDIDDYSADVIPASPSAPPPVIAGAVPKAPPPFIDIRINRAALANAIGHTTSIKTCRVFYFGVLRRCILV